VAGIEAAGLADTITGSWFSSLFLCRRSPQLPRQSTQPIRIVQNRLRHRIKRDVEVMAQ
jgi:hypothetical protein